MIEKPEWLKGKLLEQMDIDGIIQPLSKLQRDVEFVVLSHQDDLPALKKKKFNKLAVHQRNNHLDLVDLDVGSVNLLLVTDSYVVKAY